jgi:hypothetical protein
MKTILLAVALAYNVTIPATVETSLCGDGIIEGSEDSEGVHLNNKNCIKLGYGGGDLDCDSACEFDVSNCRPPASASPSPSSSPNPSSSSTAASPAAASSTTTKDDSPSLIKKLVKAAFPQAQKLIIPSRFNRFDSDGSGRIEKAEMAAAVRQWVDSWHLILEEKFAALPSPETSKLVALLEAKPTEDEINIQPGEVKELEVFTGQIELSEEELEYCDLSGDRDCNLIDLSILLYFISGQ